MHQLIAAVEHGPGMHGAALAVIAVVAVIAGLVSLVRSRMRAAKRSERERGGGG